MADAKKAAEDLEAKLRLEGQLRPKLRQVDAGLVALVTAAVSAGRSQQDVEVLVENTTATELEPILLAHYQDTGEFFDDRVRPDLVDLPEDDNRALGWIIKAALLAFFVARAPRQAQRIGATNRKDLAFSYTLTTLDREARANLGEAITQREVGVQTGRLFQQKLGGRREARAAFETLIPAEESKLAELETLVNTPGARPEGTVITKEWVTQGDSRVRGAHQAADNQSRELQQPFDVGGELLRYPGDTSLGASPENVVNCRCASIQIVEAV